MGHQGELDLESYATKKVSKSPGPELETAFCFLSFPRYTFLRASIKQLELRSGRKVALVVPAFETLHYHFSFPSSKVDLLALLDAGALYTFRWGKPLLYSPLSPSAPQ